MTIGNSLSRIDPDARDSSSKRPASRQRPVRRKPKRVATLPQLLGSAAEANPDGTALSFAGATVTYAELDARSSQLARVLIARGLGPEDLIAIGIPRSIDSIVAVWAVAKTGAGFVPVDPDYPADRVAHMITDSGALVGLTLTGVRDQLPDGIAWLALDDDELTKGVAQQSADPVSYDDRISPLRPEHTAYVIYTSGSTGRPKGVLVTHTGLDSFCAEQRERYGVSAESRALHFASPSFDASVLELLLAVGAGATMVIAPPSVYGGDELKDLFARERVTHTFITPAALSSVDPDGLDDLRVVVVGGDACGPDLVNRWATGREFYNGYGPTETTIMSNISDPLVPGQSITIGPAVRNMAAHVLDERLSPVPVGVAGELYLTGIQLARGYHHRLALTAGRFVASPSGEPGTRMYRTGDVVRRRENGAIEFIGRNDFQVKVRGFRIELGEIDAALADHPDVSFAATVGREAPSGATTLVSYVLPKAGRVDVKELESFIALSLPAYMLPSSIIVLDEIPLTPVGKLDRAALPEPIFETAAYRAPEGPLEELIASVYADVLGIDNVGGNGDFFELGGNSLIATQVAARLGAALDARIPARALFESPTVSTLATVVEPLRGQGARPALVAGPRPERVPVSFAQQRYWFLNQFDTASAVDNIPFALRLSGDLDTGALQAAFADVFERHESLRTYYPLDNTEPCQVVVPAAQAIPDLTPVVIDEHEVLDSVLAVAMRGFDVAVEVPVHARVFEVGDDCVLAFVVHHVAADGSSIAPFARDLTVAYAARTQGMAPQWAPLSVQYADYSLWQRALLGADNDPNSLAARQIDYWTEQLAGMPDQLELPGDRPRPAAQSFRGATTQFTLDGALHHDLLELSRRNGSSLFMVMHAALSVLLGRLSGTDDVAVGTPIAGRGEAVLDDLIGMFVNTLVLRVRLEQSEGFDDLLSRVRETDLQAYAHAEVPFERLVEVLNPPRSNARNPIYQIGFLFQNLSHGTLELPGLTVSPVELDANLAKTDLQVTVIDQHDHDGRPDDIVIEFSYAVDLFDQATIAQFAERYERVLRSVVADPQAPVGDIDLLETGERERVVSRWNRTQQRTDTSATLATLLDAQVAEHADNTALVACGDSGWERNATLSYAELDARVNRLARYLIDAGVGPESTVVLAMERSVELVIAMFAVAKSGGAYVPIDPSQPADRTAYQFDIVDPVCVLTTSRDSFEATTVRTVVVDELNLADYDDSTIRDSDRLAPLNPTNTAYVIFTSGSTGRPKGVSLSHGAIAHQLQWKRSEFELGADDAILVKTAATFDLSVWEYWTAAVSGGRMVLAGPGGHRDPSYLNDVLRAEEITTLHAVPSMLDALLVEAEGKLPTSLRRVLAIGEVLPAATAQRFLGGNNATLFNLYGPTEAAVSVTAHTVDAADTAAVPVGMPEWNTQVLVLDARLHPMPAGVPGELYLAGTQLARGYHGQSALTAERFVANPYGDVGARMYRTGDLVSWTEQGELQYVGRTDFQVKVRGFRIELGEIEAALLRLEDVAQVAVLSRSNESSGDQLVGYVVPTEGASIDTADLKSTLAHQLPSYMIPSASVVLDELPLTKHGKLDRQALPAPRTDVTPYRAPSNRIEDAIAAVFEDLLAVDRVSIDDDFFELGGHSLLAARASARLTKTLGIRVALQWFFTHRTVHDLARRVTSDVDTADKASDGLDVLIPIGRGNTEQPLFCVHPISGLAWMYWGLTEYVQPTRQIYGLQSPSILEADDNPASIDRIAARYVEEIRRAQPHGPYHLLGWSLGGVIAHAMATQLQAAGEEVASLTLVDSIRETDADMVRTELAQTLRSLGVDVDLDAPDGEFSLAQAQRLLDDMAVGSSALTPERAQRLFASALRAGDLMQQHRPRPFDGDVLFFSAALDHPTRADAADTWAPHVTGRITDVSIAAHHGEMMAPGALQLLGPVLGEALGAPVHARS
ncbi:amino acid adenylation domain-containing protein [Antrihabitans cavernicola]|uniref:Amino acid adenylation domain-containing protein n=1 Tax=Antrihabitans cavernicola TaxID=2495913 RepID=A0A5A7SEL7_9NOCA|nr:non-ribosomal peptide synthetase [Spelaeibacter cavernicola]KAA0022975.1 amino acid adenylation domain-containing protein [Spelaeibacter cavernicola]